MNKTNIQFDGWPHVTCSQQFGREWIEERFFNVAKEMEKVFLRGGDDSLSGKRIITLFYEPSTRTRASFEMAMSNLGGVVAFSSDNAGEFSSAKKGETFEDTIKVLNNYRPSAIVIRYNHEIGAELAARVSKVPIINAGDREPGQHPTQSLLDLLTIYRRFGKIDGLKIAMVGDLKNGRTVRSLSYLLGKFKDIRIHFVSPPDMQMGEDVKEYLLRHDVTIVSSTDLRAVARHVDVIYQTRTQTECGSVFDKSDHSLGHFVVDGNVVDSMQNHAIIMHPLPRIDEITPDVDDNHRSVYLTDQVTSGLYTRMALLRMILAPMDYQ